MPPRSGSKSESNSGSASAGRGSPRGRRSARNARIRRCSGVVSAASGRNCGGIGAGKFVALFGGSGKRRISEKGIRNRGNAGVYPRGVVGIVRGVVRRVFSIPRPESRLSRNRLAKRGMRGSAGPGAQRSRTPQNAEVLPLHAGVSKSFCKARASGRAERVGVYGLPFSDTESRSIPASPLDFPLCMCRYEIPMGAGRPMPASAIFLSPSKRLAVLSSASNFRRK